MSKGPTLRELEKRLRDEPHNLGLRVVVAGAMREAGRHGDAVELYRSVALAYREQGRIQQAISVCRSILEIAPNDSRCNHLLALLITEQPARATTSTQRAAEPEPRLTPPVPPPSRLTPLEDLARRSSLEATPLPVPMPYHEHDPTTTTQKLSDPERNDTLPDVGGIANAARRISASLVGSANSPYEPEDMSAELVTRQVRKIGTDEVAKISKPPPTLPLERLSFDEDAPTPPPSSELGDRLPAVPRPTEDELTEPRELPLGGRARNPTTDVLASGFFAALPPTKRTVVLQRFQRRTALAGATVIRQGETAHPLVIVVRGKLELCAERPNGALVQVGTVGIGEYVGEAPLLARAPSQTHVIAMVDSDLLALAPQVFYELAGAYPALWAALKDVAQRRMREYEQRLRGR